MKRGLSETMRHGGNEEENVISGPTGRMRRREVEDCNVILTTILCETAGTM